MAIHFLGVFGHHAGWNRRHEGSLDGRGLFSLEDTQIEAHAIYFMERVAGSREATDRP
jgi:hypothetical protein